MASSYRLAFTGLICLIAANVGWAQSADAASVTKEAIANAQTADYCEILRTPDKFTNKMIRVHVLYETEFEKSAIDLPSCYRSSSGGAMPMPMTWVNFDKSWESQTKRPVRREIDKIKWQVPLDVVFIGLFKSDGHYGHEDMYPYLFEVYKVESVGATK